MNETKTAVLYSLLGSIRRSLYVKRPEDIREEYRETLQLIHAAECVLADLPIGEGGTDIHGRN